MYMVSSIASVMLYVLIGYRVWSIGGICIIHIAIVSEALDAWYRSVLCYRCRVCLCVCM